jgi:23S rRNA pseudouridine1911/1915/1917 synthase
MVKTSQEIAADYSRSPLPAEAAKVPAECAGWRLDAALARLFPEHSRSRLQGWLKEGLIRIDGAVVAPKRKVHRRRARRVDAAAFRQRRPTIAAEDIPLAIVHEDDEIIVIDKPAGLVVHPGNGQPSGTLLNALLHHAPQLAEIPRAGIVHRLDKDTSGLLVVAKTLTAQTDLVRQLQARSVKRHYLALALGVVERDGTVDAPLGRHAVQRTRMAVVKSGGKEARTHYAVRERFEKCTLLECRLETGRTHQIRVHLASIKHPLAGDPVYGRTKSGDPRLDAFPRQALHAWRLALRHPARRDGDAWESPCRTTLRNCWSHCVREFSPTGRRPEACARCRPHAMAASAWRPGPDSILATTSATIRWPYRPTASACANCCRTTRAGCGRCTARCAASMRRAGRRGNGRCRIHSPARRGLRRDDGGLPAGIALRRRCERGRHCPCRLARAGWPA